MTEPVEPPQISKTRQTNAVEVLRLAACGYTDAEIGARLFLSEGAVKSRFKSIYPSIGARNRAHAVALSVALGWLSSKEIASTLETRQFRIKKSANAD